MLFLQYYARKNAKCEKKKMENEEKRECHSVFCIFTIREMQIGSDGESNKSYKKTLDKTLRLWYYITRA